MLKTVYPIKLHFAGGINKKNTDPGTGNIKCVLHLKMFDKLHFTETAVNV